MRLEGHSAKLRAQLRKADQQAYHWWPWNTVDYICPLDWCHAIVTSPQPPRFRQPTSYRSGATRWQTRCLPYISLSIR